MTIHSASGQRSGNPSLLARTEVFRVTNRILSSPKRWIFLAGMIVLASAVIAQNAPQITSVDPSSGKVNDTVVVSGSNLGKGAVASVYLSDDKNDFKTTIVDQSDAKITVKVPQVKPGDYNVSLEVGDKLFIKPVKFKVEQ
jgi:IPT/TIG domain-containing protein